MNCSGTTSEEGEFVVRLPVEADSSEYHFELWFAVRAGTTGPEFEELLAVSTVARVVLWCGLFHEFVVFFMVNP